MNQPTISLSAQTAVKGNFFFFFMAWGMSLPFIAPYLKEACGFSDKIVGLVLMITPLVAFAAQPLWSYVADRTGRPALVAAGLTLAISFIYPLGSLYTTVGAISIFFFVYALFASPLVSLGDAIAFLHLEDAHRSRYAGMRVWGTLGFLLSAAAMGIIYDAIGMKYLFAVFAAAMVLSACVLMLLSSRSVPRTQPVKIPLSKIYTDRGLIIFVLIMLGAFTANQMALTLVGIYIKKLGATNAGVGWLWTVATVAEACLMPFAGRIVRRIGVKRMILIGIASIAVRCVPMAYCTAWWQLLPLAALTSLVFVMCYVGSVIFMDTSSRPELRASAQGMFGMATMNGSLVLGNGLPGFVAEQWGYRGLYLACAGLAAVSMVLMMAFIKEPPHTSGAMR
jgi:PPP family 3-phenylpropionic acid transporter